MNFNDNTTKNTGQVLIFTVGNIRYAVKIESLIEIIEKKGVRQPSKVKSKYIVGVIDYRGEVIAVVDLRKHFQVEEESVLENQILICSINSYTIGLIVDSILEIIRIPLNRIKSIPLEFMKPAAKCFQGLIQIEDKTIVLIDENNLLMPSDLKIVKELIK